MTCSACDGSGYVEMDLEPGPGEYHDSSGRGEVRCPKCNWRPGDDEPEEVEEAMNAAMQAETEEAWRKHDLDKAEETW